MTTEIVNAVIERVSLTIEDHGLLSAWLHLDYGGSGQGFGGYALYLPSSFKHSSSQANFAGHFIYRCLEIAGAGEWKNLPGKTIRVRSTSRSIEAIGHIIKDDWFNPSEDFKEMENFA